MRGIAVVGAGDWGSNLIRNFASSKQAELKLLCDVDEARLEKQKQAYPNLKVTRNLEDLFEDSSIEAVAIATSASSHYEVAKRCLESGRHVYVEKPMTLKVSDAEELVRIAREKDRILMVGHLLEYHPAVEKLREIIGSGELGEVYYLYAQRVNLGKIRKDENALWSFAPHDISIILYLLDEEPDEVSARGEAYLQPGIHDVVFLNLHFPHGKMANIQLSWLDPHKIRKLTIVGSRKMVVFDDMESSEKIRIYDKGVTPNQVVSYGDSFTLRFGNILIPRIDMVEPLRVECEHFLSCVNEGSQPRSDGNDGLRVVKVLAAAQDSLDKGGHPVRVAAGG